MNSPSDIIPDGYFEDDWKPNGACRGDDRFIREPDPATARILEDICAGCLVRVDCAINIYEFDPVSVFQAGEWRPEKDG